ncbi:ferredoxin [[Mycobacterium] wendilense]|uniref:Ferredoxin n=1 Tax=[Mycobacterium] wendilense TaxID=3064284 RepID=A0ABN9P884_9MYCO|nr:ferredoxin [Mycolicibacterium sp. MU0050]CAJ1584623.1 ferredoxin [Mycolicibacterium sp. MU0050]
MKVEIDYGRCEGHGVCVGLAPEVFALEDDDEQVRLLTDTPDASLAEAVTLAGKRCPIQAIRISS